MQMSEQKIPETGPISRLLLRFKHPHPIPSSYIYIYIYGLSKDNLQEEGA